MSPRKSKELAQDQAQESVVATEEAAERPQFANPRSWIGHNERQPDGSIAGVNLLEHRYRDENDKPRMEMLFAFNQKPSDGVRGVMKAPENRVDFEWRDGENGREPTWFYTSKYSKWSDIRDHAYAVYDRVVKQMITEAKAQTKEQEQTIPF